jgi:hypothetical protein
MFRSVSKKRQRLRERKVDDPADDDDAGEEQQEDNHVHILQRSKKKVTPRSSKSNRTRSTSPRRTSLRLSQQQHQHQQQQSPILLAPKITPMTTSYDATALAALQAEQQFLQKQNTTENDAPMANDPSPPPLRRGSTPITANTWLHNSTTPLEDPWPSALGPSPPPDENDNDFDTPFPGSRNHAESFAAEDYIPLESAATDALHMWESEVVSRGEADFTVPNPLWNSPPEPSYPMDTSYSESYTNIPQQQQQQPSLPPSHADHWHRLQQQLQLTLQQLQAQQQDSTIQRRTYEVQQTQEELAQQTQDMERAGSALEFYQELRSNLTTWVGALRELRQKVRPLVYAVHELEAHIANLTTWRTWEDDMLFVLARAGMLEHVLGRQPTMDPPMAPTVDEFGRDVHSQWDLAREKRLHRRQRITMQRQQRHQDWRGDESDALTSDNEQENLREQHSALRQALDVALEGLEEEYTCMHNCIALFQKWKLFNPDDYQQTYASLSLADLASVLIETELCSLNDPWNESEGFHESKWTTAIHQALDEGVLDEVSMERLLERSVLIVVKDLLDKQGYNCMSRRQSRSLGSFYKHITKIIRYPSPMLTRVQECIIGYVEQQLNDLALPVVHPWVFSTPIVNAAVQQAVHAATVVQLHRIKRILLNVLQHWGPVFRDTPAFVQCVLQFLSARFLPWLSALQQHWQPPALSETPADVYKLIWRQLIPLEWLKHREYTIHLGPLREAAKAYQLIQPVGP